MTKWLSDFGNASLRTWDLTYKHSWYQKWIYGLLAFGKTCWNIPDSISRLNSYCNLLNQRSDFFGCRMRTGTWDQISINPPSSSENIPHSHLGVLESGILHSEDTWWMLSWRCPQHALLLRSWERKTLASKRQHFILQYLAFVIRPTASGIECRLQNLRWT